MNDLRNQPEEVRARIRDIVTRANRDQQFQRDLAADPLSALQAAGLSAGTAETVMSVTPEVPEAAEVQGFARCQQTCIDTTCWIAPGISFCPASCLIGTVFDC
jgi:hypothetical protein